jgi:hypothetical protein
VEEASSEVDHTYSTVLHAALVGLGHVEVFDKLQCMARHAQIIANGHYQIRGSVLTCRDGVKGQGAIGNAWPNVFTTKGGSCLGFCLLKLLARRRTTTSIQPDEADSAEHQHTD